MTSTRLERAFVAAAVLSLALTAVFGVAVVRALHAPPELLAVHGSPGADAQGATTTAIAGSAGTAGTAGTAATGGSTGGTGAARAASGAATPVPPSVCPFPGGVMHIGSIVSLTGFFQFPEEANAAKAYFQDANAHGGVHGCRVDDRVLDDGTDPGTAMADAKQLVAEDHVLAVVSMMSPFGQDSVDPYFAAPGGDNNGQAVPVVGLDPYEEGAFRRPNQFDVDVDIYDAGTLMAQYADTEMKGQFRHPGIFGYNVSQVTAAEDGTVSQFKRDGYSSIEEQTVDPSASNYDQIVQKFHDDGVDLVMWFCDLGCGDRFVAAAQKYGYSFKWVNYAIGYDQGYARQFGQAGGPEDGMPVISPFLPFEAQTPALQRLYDTVEHYYPGTPRNYVTEQAWLGAQLFATEMSRLPLTTDLQHDQQLIIQAIAAERSLDLGGLTPPLNFAVGSDSRYATGRVAHRCAQFLVIHDGTLEWRDHTWHCPPA